MKRTVLVFLLALHLAWGLSWAQVPARSHSTHRHRSKKASKKRGHKTRKGKGQKKDGAELESQVTAKDVQFNSKISTK